MVARGASTRRCSVFSRGAAASYRSCFSSEAASFNGRIPSWRHLARFFFFFALESLFGRRASWNIRNRSAARPPGGSGVLSPGRLTIFHLLLGRCENDLIQ